MLSGWLAVSREDPRKIWHGATRERRGEGRGLASSRGPPETILRRLAIRVPRVGPTRKRTEGEYQDEKIRGGENVDSGEEKKAVQRRSEEGKWVRKGKVRLGKSG